MELCLLAAGATIRLGTVALTLAWTHSIEKTRWVSRSSSCWD